MKIIEALKELPLIEKKIEKKISDIRKYSSGLDRAEDTDLPFITVEKQRIEVDALKQSVKDLVNRKAKLRTNLSMTNAKTKVTIDGMTLTISEWIEYREKGLSNLIRAQEALGDFTAQDLLRSTHVDLQKGIKTIRFFDEKAKNEEVIRLTAIKDNIDGRLEVVNATTDLIEEL